MGDIQKFHPKIAHDYANFFIPKHLGCCKVLRVNLVPYLHRDTPSPSLQGVVALKNKDKLLPFHGRTHT
jgi:hypothetical protein